MVDLHAHYKYNERRSFDAGIDNVNNYKFALFHPFPQRTWHGQECSRHLLCGE